MKTLTVEQIDKFQKLIYDFYKKNKREFIWREQITPYKILISEVMLQQTQTSRVIPKFETWIEIFPDFEVLASASNHEVLSAWQGLGYNRRGLALAKIAQLVINDHNGQLPSDPNILKTFPAIGENTAGSICAFAFDKNNARDWYYALMDYGVHLKKELPRINSASKHYTRQSKFEGSKRQVRGLIIKILTQLEKVEYQELIEMINFQIPENTHDRHQVIEDLVSEKIIYQSRDILSL